MLKMTDEAGSDEKLLAVPVDKLITIYRKVQSPRDLPEITLNQIAHFFAHYKALEAGKWVKVEGWSAPKRPRKPFRTASSTTRRPRKSRAIEGIPLYRPGGNANSSPLPVPPRYA